MQSLHQDSGGSCTEAKHSILRKSDAATYWAGRWLTQSSFKRRQVRFSDNGDDDEEEDRTTLPILNGPAPISKMLSNSAAMTAGNNGKTGEDERLPPLLAASAQQLSGGGTSWAERQVAKVRQRRLWAQQQGDSPPETPLIKLPPTAEDDGGRRRREEESSAVSSKSRGITWEILVDTKTNTAENLEEDDEEEEAKPYDGWAHFPARLASRIRNRHDKLTKDSQKNKKQVESNPFLRRKKFGRTLLERLLRRRMKKPSSSIDIAPAGHSCRAVTARKRNQTAITIQQSRPLVSRMPPLDNKSPASKRTSSAGPLSRAVKESSPKTDSRECQTDAGLVLEKDRPGGSSLFEQLQVDISISVSSPPGPIIGGCPSSGGNKRKGGPEEDDSSSLLPPAEEGGGSIDRPTQWLHLDGLMMKPSVKNEEQTGDGGAVTTNPAAVIIPPMSSSTDDAEGPPSQVEEEDPSDRRRADQEKEAPRRDDGDENPAIETAGSIREDKRIKDVMNFISSQLIPRYFFVIDERK